MSSSIALETDASIAVRSTEFPLATLSLGDFAKQIIQEQFDRITKQKKLVLADQDAEHLHQMRVGTRRLRTALQVFAMAVQLPKVANQKRLRDLARVLGAVRDLDVQMAHLKEHYQPQLNQDEQKHLKKVLASLEKQRQVAFKEMRKTLKDDNYEALSKAYQTWLKQPEYTAIGQLPLSSVLPDLLSPLLSHLLLHPGWQISIDHLTSEQHHVLHDLRKAFKQVRYQTEFFTPLYGEEFKLWVKEIKAIQDDLGDFQDTHILLEQLAESVELPQDLPELQLLIQQQQSQALKDWEQVRQRYLDADFRYGLHRLVLQPLLLRSSN